MIRVEGPPDDVEQATSMLLDLVNDLVYKFTATALIDFVHLSLCLSVSLPPSVGW